MGPVMTFSSEGGVANPHTLFQDNKAMNMFSMDHMLKDGWSGFYSQGYMYFDNCSSLFLPKVCDQCRPFVCYYSGSLVVDKNQINGGDP